MKFTICSLRSFKLRPATLSMGEEEVMVMTDMGTARMQHMSFTK